jgi:hypothetical protein
MRCLVLLLSLVLLGTVATGCSSGWWQRYRTDPAARVQSAIDAVHSAVALSDLVFHGAIAGLPPDAGDEARARYEAAVVAVERAMSAMRAALDGAAEAERAQPDLRSALGRLVKAIEDLAAAACSVRAVTRGHADEGCLDELRAQLAIVRRLAEDASHIPE